MSPLHACTSAADGAAHDDHADLVIIGSGVAGLTAAWRARELGLRVLVLTKASGDEVWGPSAVSPRGAASPDSAASVAASVRAFGSTESRSEELTNTACAQGGIAGVRPNERDPGDDVALHAQDTITAGAGLCDPEVVTEILSSSAEAIARLQRAGARFDRDATGQLSRTREGGHSASRVIHAGGDATGAEVLRALLQRVADEGIEIRHGYCAVRIVHSDSGELAGVLALDAAGVPRVVQAPALLLATGGLGQLYSATSNPAAATADGIALALRAGAVVSDVEFIQFHPTVLYTPHATATRRPLITEAVRGEGGVLVDSTGRRVITQAEHPLADVAPRDVVAAAVNARQLETGADHVFLDATGMAERFHERFPTVFASCQAVGVDPRIEPIPVTSAAHYACGGVNSSVDGRTSVSGLYAAGEVARTGLHGANRLASNSLLEGVVMGVRAAEAAARDLHSGVLSRVQPGAAAEEIPAQAVADRAVLQRVMSRDAGILRSAAGLAAARAALERASVVRPLQTQREIEDAALLLTAETVLKAASARTESRGCHRRRDFPAAQASLARPLPFRLDVAGRLMAGGFAQFATQGRAA